MADLTNKTQNLVDNNAGGGGGDSPRPKHRLTTFIEKNILGRDTGVRTPAQNATPTTNNNTSPAKATAAPTGNTNYIFTGLAEALNTHQNQLVKDKKYAIADIYEFEFNPVSMGEAKLKKPGSTDRSKTAGKEAKTAGQALNSKTDKVDNNSQNWSVLAGTQIVQYIDQVMRSSSYIYDQATTQVDPNTQKPIPSPGTGTGITTWYKISVQATSLGYDNLRRDDAYRIKYLITPYAITQMASEYFPDSRYRGSHKTYGYWFTGQNTQIINFEQTFNTLYKLTLSGAGSISQSNVTTDFRDIYSKTYMPTTEQKTGQQTGTYTNAGPDSAAAYLYSPNDLATVKFRIIGDPGWLQQGEVSTGISAQQFSFAPFNLDGGINFDSQEVLFDIGWNQPQDYNMETGVMNTNNQNGRSIQNNTYQAIDCRSFFSKGKFEQEIMGKQFVEFRKATTRTPAEVRPTIDTSVVKPPAKNIAAPKTIVENGGGAAFVNPTGIRRTTPNPGSLSDRVQKENIRRSGLDFG
jgi:hypothetical protein